MQVYVILSPGFEEVEAVTVIDIMRRAGIGVTTVSLNGNTAVMGSHGIVVMADESFEEAKEKCGDAVVLPGGMKGVTNMLASDGLKAFVKKHYDAGAVVAAVCAAPLVLDELGILRAGRFTCHPCVHDRVKCESVQNAPAVVDDRIVTGRSAGCAMVWSIELVRRLLGELPISLLEGLRMDAVG